MKIKHFLIALASSLFISHCLVVIFLMFGPLYVGGEFAILQSGKWTVALAAVLFFPTLALVRRFLGRATRKDGDRS